MTELIAVGRGRKPGCGVLVFRNIREAMPGCCGFYEQEADKLTPRTYCTLAERACSDCFETAVEKVRYYRIAEYLYTLPWEYKDYEGVEKGDWMKQYGVKIVD